jgi:quercetin dioxygenase-like cupin family protein
VTAGTVIGGPPRIPMPGSYGVITADLSGLGEVRNLVGGSGTALWKQLINGMHLPGPWGCVEYVELRPGASCGRHLHAAREEVYYILDGTARMSVNGDEVAVTPGDLITCPIGTIHGIGVPEDAGQGMSFLVIEMSPGGGPPKAPPYRIPVPASLDGCAGYRGGGRLQETLLAAIDLGELLTGPWGRFSLIEVPAGDALGPSRLPPGIAEVLFVADGAAEVTAAGVLASGGRGLTVGTPLGADVGIRNAAPDGPLTVISVQVAA